MPVVEIAGITIRLHVTLLILVALVAIGARGVGETPVAAVGWLVHLFACVVVHEFAHAVVARAKGIGVHEIDLLPIGGVSRMERIPEDWRDEAAIAVAGPVTSALIGVAALALAAALRVPLLPIDPWRGPIVARLGWVNLLLATFNLLPAFPLDGGRVLRALLERRMSRVVATHRAARISRVLAGGFIVGGILWNLWLVLIGIFVIVAGKAEEAAVLVHAALGTTAASTLAVPCPVVLDASWPAETGLRVASEQPQIAYPVLDQHGNAVSAVTVVDLRRAAPFAPLGQLGAGLVIDGDEGLETLAERFTGTAAVVTRGRTVLGVVTPELLAGYLNQRAHELGV